MPLAFRRDPTKHFKDTSRQVIKMLVQDLVVILDEMMDEALAARGERAGNFPQSKIEKLKKSLDKRYHWAANGCFELVAVRNVLTHNQGIWNEKSIDMIKAFVDPLPKEGDKLSVGFSMLFQVSQGDANAAQSGVARRLTIRSSRPRIVASATCLRYASTRPPPRCGAAQLRR